MTLLSLLLIVVPLVAASLALLWPEDHSRPLILLGAAVVHTAMIAWLMFHPPAVAADAWMGFDPTAAAILPSVSLLFLICAWYAVAYLRLRSERPNRIFVTALLAVLGLLSAGHQARHVGLLWICTEGVTLAAVPLLHFNGTSHAFEATWKYLLVGGTGIALSLLGSFCLGYASLYGGGEGDLTFVALMAEGHQLSSTWVIIAWVLTLVGYGTKMGLAPMHTWKPEAYGEAPAIVGAILAGAVTSVAFNAILRIHAVVIVSGQGALADRMLLTLGLFSMVVAAVFLLRVTNYKRMLAYSSVENMGILAVGASLGSAGVGAALFHLWSNSLTKSAVFLSAGNIRRASGSAWLQDVRGMAFVTPRSSALFVAGVFAVTALPPFGPFFSELLVLRAALSASHGVAVAVFLGSLLFTFWGLTRITFRVVDGRPHPRMTAGRAPFIETLGVILPPLVLLLMSLWLGLFTPSILRETWSSAVLQLVPTP